MITKVVHGWRPAGLLAYLLGPGTAEVHQAPRVIASWDGLDADWQPASTGPGEYDLALGPLITALHAPAIAAGLPTRAPAENGKRGYVWHCSARVAATDQILADGEWAGIARELLDGAGVAVSGDAGGPRWVAVRHADDHIHIAVVLVRQDTGRRFWPHHDYPKLRATARRIEQRLGLTVTAAPDGTAAARPSRGEISDAGWGERQSTGHATAAWRVGAVPPPAKQRAHHDPTNRELPDVAEPRGADGRGTYLGTGFSTHAVGGSVVSDRQEQAVLAVVRLVGDQDVEVTAQHASSTSTAVTVRIGRALLYLNDQATAAHFHKVWFDAAAHARTLPPVGHPAHRGLVRELRGMPEPGIVANATGRPACSVAMVAGEPADSKPFLRVQLGRVAFEIRDFAAYRSCLGAFRQAHHMARDVFLPPGSTRVYNGALTAARDAFYPHTPEASDTPADRQATGPRRRVVLVTDRSAPVPPVAPRRRTALPAAVPQQIPQQISQQSTRPATQQSARQLPVRGQTA